MGTVWSQNKSLWEKFLLRDDNTSYNSSRRTVWRISVHSMILLINPPERGSRIIFICTNLSVSVHYGVWRKYDDRSSCRESIRDDFEGVPNCKRHMRLCVVKPQNNSCHYCNHCYYHRAHCQVSPAVSHKCKTYHQQLISTLAYVQRLLG